MAEPLTADTLVAIVNQLGLTEEQVAIAFAGAKANAQGKTIAMWLEEANATNAELMNAENAELAPLQQAVDDKRAEIEPIRSVRANAMAAAQAVVQEIAAGRLLTDEEMAGIHNALTFEGVIHGDLLRQQHHGQ